MRFTDRLKASISLVVSPDTRTSLLCLYGKSGGTGKTTTVRKIISGLTKDDENGNEFPLTYSIFNGGRATGLGIWRWTEENKDSDVLILDDLDNISKNKTVISFLKAICNTNGDGSRVMTYASGEEVKQFSYSGSIIIITNSIGNEEQWDSLKSRSIFLRYDPCVKEIFSKMDKLTRSNETYPALSLEERLDVLNLIREHYSPLSSSEFSLRTLIRGFDARISLDNWKEFIVEELGGESKIQSFDLIKELHHSKMTVKEQIKRFKDQTGMSRKTFFNHRNKLFTTGLLKKSAA